MHVRHASRARRASGLARLSATPRLAPLDAVHAAHSYELASLVRRSEAQVLQRLVEEGGA